MEGGEDKQHVSFVQAVRSSGAILCQQPCKMQGYEEERSKVQFGAVVRVVRCGQALAAITWRFRRN